MAISTSYSEVLKDFNTSRWDSIDKFEEYYLLRIAETISGTNYYTNKDGDRIAIDQIDHHPKLKEYEVWREGYRATGENGSATMIGKCFARNFAQACHIVMCKKFLEVSEEICQPEYTDYCDPNRWDYKPSVLQYWGCNLFWSEELAKKSFG